MRGALRLYCWMTLYDGALVPNKHHHTVTNHGNWDILSHVLFSLARSLPI